MEPVRTFTAAELADIGEAAMDVIFDGLGIGDEDPTPQQVRAGMAIALGVFHSIMSVAAQEAPGITREAFQAFAGVPSDAST